jgi:beta-galactosidase
MKHLRYLLYLCAFIAISTNAQSQSAAQSGVKLFNADWQFVKDADTAINARLFQKNSGGWVAVSLPHTANIEPVVKVAQQWQGICYYRKFFTPAMADKGKHLAIRIDAAMSEADVYLNGKYLMKHKGGYLPFYIDISNAANFGKENCLLIRLNNQDNPTIPPGKPIKDLDFNYYSGIYRNAWIVKKNKLHISDAVAVNHINGGGVLLHYDNVSASSAQLSIKTEIQNDYDQNRPVIVEASLYNAAGKLVGTSATPSMLIKNGNYGSLKQQIQITDPQLWSPAHAYLYKLKVIIKSNGSIIDSMSLRTGIRQVEFKADGFYLNGSKYVLRGTNRHQEYPYIGNALSDHAQYRDAYKIKQAGFDFVRCSHYPPSPAFLDACDELGIFIMDSIPGWQFFGDEAFQQNSLQDVADMLHRDRNHTSVILWESSLNETGMKKDYMEKAHKLVHAELPYGDTYTCGWIDAVFDVFIPARQHAKAPDYWKKYSKNKPLFIAEYGDWEYYAQNAGFNQTEYQNLKKEEKTSRQLRTDGQVRMLQQAYNYQESHNDNLNGKIAGDANWLVFDYKRGYAPDIESSGIMDIFRLPKFAYYFYQSQLSTQESEPMLFIANYWNDPQVKNVKIFSNCDEVELLLNGKSLGKQKPDTGSNENNLKHPPFTFRPASYTPGTLTAVGYIKGKKVVTQSQSTPASAYKIVVKADVSNKRWTAGQKDAIFVYAYITDQNGTVIPNAANKITFTITGDAQIIGDKAVSAEAGIAPALIQAGNKGGSIKVTATGADLKAGVWSYVVK